MADSFAEAFKETVRSLLPKLKAEPGPTITKRGLQDIIAAINTPGETVSEEEFAEYNKYLATIGQSGPVPIPEVGPAIEPTGAIAIRNPFQDLAQDYPYNIGVALLAIGDGALSGAINALEREVVRREGK